MELRLEVDGLGWKKEKTRKERKTREISFPRFGDGGVVEVRLQNNNLLWDKREVRSSVYPIYNSHLQIQFSRREKRHRDTARLSGNLKERDETRERGN